MKRSYFFLAVSGVVLSACTSEEVVNEGVLSNAIGFENTVMRQSRAGDVAVSGDLTNANLDKFLVYGFYTKENETANPIQVFAGDAVIKEGENKWTYKNTRYWVPGATYNFFAYSCSDIALDNTYGTIGLDLNSTGDARQLIISNFRCDNFHNHDLIYAQSKNHLGLDKDDDNPEPNKPVSFTFEHILSKIDAVFISEFSSDYDIVIKDVKIVNFRNKGTFTKTGGWKDQLRDNSNPTVLGGSVQNIEKQLAFNTEDGLGVAKSASATTPALQPKTASIYMIPYAYTAHDVQIAFTIELYKDTEHTAANLVMSRPMQGTWSPKWELGYYYTYTIRLTGTAANLQPIVFETAKDLNGWTQGSSTATDISFSTN